MFHNKSLLPGNEQIPNRSMIEVQAGGLCISLKQHSLKGSNHALVSLLLSLPSPVSLQLNLSSLVSLQLSLPSPPHTLVALGLMH